jgi:CubicO group peptidase (beta-lactamase class C family)
LRACADEIGRGPAPRWQPGTRFAYGGTGYQVAGAVVEVVTGRAFVDEFDERIARPLAMTQTRFDATSSGTTRNPQLAGSAVSTVEDYGRFVTMLANHGEGPSGRVLSASSVAEIERNQVEGVDTSGDAAVHVTGIPTYGLGVWRDVTAPDGSIRVLSGSGAFGFYPWIDRRHDTWGIVGVADYRGSDRAVPESARLARQSWRAAARAARG